MTDVRPTNAEILAVLSALIRSLERADTTEGCCCCGVDMAQHTILDNHAPIDIGHYHSRMALAQANRLFSRLSTYNPEDIST